MSAAAGAAVLKTAVATYAHTKATAPCEKLKIPDVWYARTIPDAMIE